ncbi:MAG: leucine-rich repeat domain-containing protein [Clostridia bacterium]|nr:leucine-rich repeat domain-containing protein [Clostridia bacterium]
MIRNKIRILLIAAAAALLLLPAISLAAGPGEVGYVFRVNQSGAVSNDGPFKVTVTSVNPNTVEAFALLDNTSGWITVPAEVKDAAGNKYAVTAIADKAFSGNWKVNSVTIPGSVTKIGVSAFEECSALNSVTLANGLTQIGNYAFRKCKALRGISIPDSVTQIGMYAFANCSELASVSLPSGLTVLNTGVFNGCGKLNNVRLPNGLTQIGGYAFAECSGLSSITFPDGLTKILNYAFRNCALTDIALPDGVTSIDKYAFYHNTSLQTVSLPPSLSSMSTYAFANCTALTCILIPDTIGSINSSAFSGCTTSKLNVIFYDRNKTSAMSSFAKAYNMLPSGLKKNAFCVSFGTERPANGTLSADIRLVGSTPRCGVDVSVNDGYAVTAVKANDETIGTESGHYTYGLTPVAWSEGGTLAPVVFSADIINKGSPSGDPLPPTGDASAPLLWLTLCLLSASAVFTLRRKRS